MWRFKFVTLIFLFAFCLLFISFTNVYAQVSAPGTPSNVLVSYPACTGQDCSFANAKCTWGSATGAATYSIKITEVDSGTVTKTDSVPSSTLTYTFPVTSGRTYKCEVTAVNSSGTAGATGSHSLLCQTDTFTPSATPVPAIPTKVPPLPPPKAGNETVFMSIAAISGVIILIGVSLVFVL